MQYTMQSRVLADCRLFSPRRLLSFLHWLPFHPTFLALSHYPCVLLLFPPDFHHPNFFSSFSFLSSCCPPFCARCPGKLTVTFGNDPLQTSAQWHHNKSRNFSSLSPLLSLWAQTRDDCPRTTINRSLPWSLSSPLDACSVVPRRVQTCFRVLTGSWPTPERFSWAGTLCMSPWACACVSVGLSLVGGCFSSD